VDGVRLDAIPYLTESEGTNCENLAGTHEIIAGIHQMLDREFPGTITLAEANQWPEDVVEYFGTEEAPECTMCFHFPVMPRIFYALRQGPAPALRRGGVGIDLSFLVLVIGISIVQRLPAAPGWHVCAISSQRFASVLILKKLGTMFSTHSHRSAGRPTEHHGCRG